MRSFEFFALAASEAQDREMEGPSLVIAAEEFQKYLGQPILRVSGTAQLRLPQIKRERLRQVTSWGKHFLLVFDTFALRVHFLMFGSYRINLARENREPKLKLHIAGDDIYFYSCAIKEIGCELEMLYDWSNDIMAKEWSSKKALNKVLERPKAMVCDILMDQEIFSGVGNIMKNEILYKSRLHPETAVLQLDKSALTGLVREARKYARQFYLWKKDGVLKRNWIVFRKKICGGCGKKVTKRPTGRLKRVSHYCTQCQPKFPKP